jgi:hypothetical protein
VTRRRTARDEGTAAIEVVGFLPVVAVVVLIAVQVVFATATINATNQAVRDGARAHSLGDPVRAAVDRSLPDAFTADRVVVDGTGRVTVEVPMPRVALFPRFVITRTAVMP